MNKGAQELKDLDVDRVDGVDKPATGRNFLLFKSEDGNAIMKGYGMVATAAHAVLEKIRSDKNATVSRKSAIALNGLAQVLGEDAVFVGKSVPTQPYVFAEPDADKRGPADENLGANFTPRSMPGSMVGSVQFSIKDEAGDTTDSAKDAKKQAYEEPQGKGPVRPLGKDKDEDEEPEGKKPWEGKTRGKTKQAEEEDEDEMDGAEKADRGVARSLKAMTEAIQAQTKAINKALGLSEVSKDEDGEKAEKAERKPRSRQIEDEEPVRVRKDAGGYEPRFSTSFANIAFGDKR